MNNLVESAILSVQQSIVAFCRYITANDVGKTGSHQAGFYLPKCAYALAFDTAGVRRENKDKYVKIKWQNDFVTDSRFIYYGVGTRNEYRLTRFGRDFPFLTDENVGDLLVVAKMDKDDYSAFVLQNGDEIETFLSAFNLAPEQTNQLIDAKHIVKPEALLKYEIERFVSQFTDFPETRTMALGTQTCYNKVYRITDKIIRMRPDETLIGWRQTEFHLFQSLEEYVYKGVVSQPFGSVAHFINVANTILNRRKSRSGKSLEHHLATIFKVSALQYEAQVLTEGKKRPDFLFPDGKSYHNMSFPTDKLVVLGVKTSCKDRWRQVLSEANRVKTKHLFTLQPALSKNQLKEMKESCLRLVVPKQHISSFPKEYQSEISSLHSFIEMVREKQIS